MNRYSNKEIKWKSRNNKWTKWIFKVFSDTTRLRILEVLLNEETSVGVIANKINASNSAVSHQLSYLRSTNLVKTRKEGQVIYYSIADNHIKVIIEYGLEHIKEGIKLWKR